MQERYQQMSPVADYRDSRTHKERLRKGNLFTLEKKKFKENLTDAFYWLRDGIRSPALFRYAQWKDKTQWWQSAERQIPAWLITYIERRTVKVWNGLHRKVTKHLTLQIYNTWQNMALANLSCLWSWPSFKQGPGDLQMPVPICTSSWLWEYLLHLFFAVI